MGGEIFGLCCQRRVGCKLAKRLDENAHRNLSLERFRSRLALARAASNSPQTTDHRRRQRDF
jgi:hypothetical protein